MFAPLPIRRLFQIETALIVISIADKGYISRGAMSLWGDVPNWVYDSSASLMQALKSVDHSTYEHCCRVGELSRRLALDVGLNEYEQKIAEFSGLFHDIGKIGIDQAIIHKPGKLEHHEYEIMKKHSEMSESILQPFKHNSFFQNLLPSVRGHHERMDGQGYPDKIAGDKIPLFARIILVVDTYDAMTNTRSYRKGLPDEVCYKELIRCSGTQFDEHIAKIFIESHKKWSVHDRDQTTEHLLIRRVI